jgi:hypothetical protein
MSNPKPEPDEPVKIPLDPVNARRASLQVDPDAEPVAGEGVTQEAADSATQPEADGTNEG